MFSVALIGPDGAGKTTLTARLRESATIPVKCLYMGINIEASNHALPTSRLVAYFKRRQNKESGVYRCVDDSAPVRGNAKRGLSGWLWATGRLINRLLEEWYRQLLSWGYQMSGYAVVYDRHFLYDFTLDGIDGEKHFDQIAAARAFDVVHAEVSGLIEREYRNSRAKAGRGLRFRLQRLARLFD